MCPLCNIEMDKKHPYSVHKIKYADFIEQHFPRKDLYDNTPIKWKSDESYLLSDFNTKVNLRKYLESITKEDGMIYLADFLKRRKKLKNIDIAPSEFEAKSLTFPAISYIEKYYGEGAFRKICSYAEVHSRYNYIATTTFNRDISASTFLCDTREQKPLKLPNMKIQKLDFGDYTVKDDYIFIERKSLSDFIGTMSSGYERFNKEIELAIFNQAYLVVLIEEKYSSLQSFEYLPHIYSKCDWTFISHRFRELMSRYPHSLQFLAVDGRKEAERVIPKIYGLNVDKLDRFYIDLQYAYNKGEL